MDKELIPYLQKIEESLKKELPENTNAEWQNETFGKLSSCVKNEHILNLIKPCRNLMDLGGKRWRPLLMVLCYKLSIDAGKKPLITEEELYSLTSLVEFVHTASLIHDDIEDSSNMRRGKPSAHITYGLDTALNAGSWLYFEAAKCIQELKASDSFKNSLYELYTILLRRLHLGQAMDIYWHSNPEMFPLPEEYSQMVHLKTGTLSSLATQTGLLAGGFSKQEALNAGKISEMIGEGFQILDDVQNLTTGNPGKKRGDDIVEGKKSLPVLIHINENPSDKEKISRLFKNASSEGIESESVEKCIELLEKHGAIQKAKQKGEKCIRENVEKLSTFGNVSQTKESSVLIRKLFLGMIP